MWDYILLSIKYATCHVGGTNFELQELVSDEKYKCGHLEELKPKYLNIPESKEGPCHSLLTLDVVAVGRTGILYDVIIKR